jgi:hypothetical protein
LAGVPRYAGPISLGAILRLAIPTIRRFAYCGLSPRLRTMFFLENDRKDDVPKGVEQAIMAAQNFEPELKDVVRYRRRCATLVSVEPIKPNGDVILWNLYIQRAGA